VAESPPPRPLPGEHSRLYRIGVMLLNGYGYNWYRQDNQMRADDLLIRSRAGEYLEGALAKLRDLESGYRRQYLPPPTRAHPDPDPRHLAAARQFQDFTARIREVETSLRGAAVPPDDKVWQRHRSELDTLQRLGECDALLVAAAKELDELVAGLPADAALDPAADQGIDRRLAGLQAIMGQRGEILAMSG
jgi:hypothetical protein